METLLRELRYGLRILTKSPGFAVVAVLTLALGIGASAAIFSVVDAVLLHALPYPRPEKIVRVWEQAPNGHRMNLADLNFDDFQAQNNTFADLAAYGYGPSSVSGGSEPVRVNIAIVSSGFFKALGVEPSRGRAFAPEERRVHGTPAAIVSYSYWQRYLGGATDLSQFHLRMEAAVYSVVGVMPEGFDFPSGIGRLDSARALSGRFQPHRAQLARPRPRPRWDYRRPGARESQRDCPPHQTTVRKRRRSQRRRGRASCRRDGRRRAHRSVDPSGSRRPPAPGRLRQRGRFTFGAHLHAPQGTGCACGARGGARPSHSAVPRGVFFAFLNGRRAGNFDRDLGGQGASGDSSGEFAAAARRGHQHLGSAVRFGRNGGRRRFARAVCRLARRCGRSSRSADRRLPQLQRHRRQPAVSRLSGDRRNCRYAGDLGRSGPSRPQLFAAGYHESWVSPAKPDHHGVFASHSAMAGSAGPVSHRCARPIWWKTS